MADEDQKDPWEVGFKAAEEAHPAAAPAKDQALAADAATLPADTPPATPPAAPPLNAPPSEAPSNPWENAFSQGAPLEKPRYGTNIKLPDVHSGVSDEDLIKSFGYDPKEIYKSPTYQWLKQKAGTGFGFMLAPQTKDDLRGFILRDSPIGALGQGAMDTLLGAAQLGVHTQAKLLGDDNEVPYWDLLNKVSDQNYLQNIQRGNQAGYNAFVRSAAPALIPVGGAELEGARLAPAIARGVATGAGFGLFQPVYTDPNDPNSYNRQLAAHVGFGAAGGGGGATAARMLSGSFGRFASMFKTPLPEDAAADMATKLHGAMNGDWGDLSDLNVADPRLASRARTASEAIANAGSDPTKIEQAVIKLQNFRTAARANELYDTVTQIAGGANKVPVTNTLATMQKLLKELTQVKEGGQSIDENTQLVNSIKGWMENLQPHTVEPEPPPGVMGNVRAYSNWKAANPPQVIPGGNNFLWMQAHSNDLGDMIDSGMGANGMIAPQHVRRLQQIKDAIDQDLNNFSQSAAAPPGLAQAQQAADDYYRAYRKPFLDRSVAKAGTTDMPDTLFNMFIRGGDHADLAGKFYNVLTPKGRAAVQSQMLDRIINEATPALKKQNILGAPSAEPAYLNAKTFIESLNRYKPALDVFFQGKDQQALQGVENLMRHYGTAVDRGRIPMGVLAGGATALLGHHMGIPYNADIAGGVGVGGAAIKWLMNTDAGRKIAANAFTLKPATPEMTALWGKLLPMVPYISRFGATGGVRATNPTITVKPWQPPSGFASGGLAERLRRNTLESLISKNIRTQR